MESARHYIDRVLGGDTDAFRHIVHDYQRLVSHVIGRLIDNTEDREELGQEVFVKAYQNLKSFRDESKFSTWIARIAHNTAINFLQKKRPDLYDDLVATDDDSVSFMDYHAGNETAPDESAFREDRSRILQDAVERLPGKYKTILTLYHVDQLSYLEIADIMEMPEGTVKNYLFRARQKLKDFLLARYAGEAVQL